MDDIRLFENKIEDKSKLKKIALYMRDRYSHIKYSEQEMEKGKWLDQWSKLYPNPTKMFLYQALIYVGEYAAARSLLPSHSHGEYK